MILATHRAIRPRLTVPLVLLTISLSALYRTPSWLHLPSSNLTTTPAALLFPLPLATPPSTIKGAYPWPVPRIRSQVQSLIVRAYLLFAKSSTRKLTLRRPSRCQQYSHRREHLSLCLADAPISHAQFKRPASTRSSRCAIKDSLCHTLGFSRPHSTTQEAQPQQSCRERKPEWGADKGRREASSNRQDWHMRAGQQGPQQAES